MIKIRKMEAGDIGEVFCMMRVFYDSPAVLHTSSDEVLKKDLEDAVSDLPFLEGFVFEKEGRLVGYSLISLNYTTEYGGICVWIEDLYLMPEERGQGFSIEFFRFLEQYYPNAVRFKLEVEAENEMAIASYQKNGYRVSPYYLMTKEMKQDNGESQQQ